MKFEAIQAVTETEQLVQQVERLILTGQLAVHEKLPSERDLATTLQVSRSVVNRGLQELMRLGFIEVRPRQGNFVADYERNGNLETLNVIINFDGGNYHPAMLKSIFRVRQLIENDMLRQCAPVTSFRSLERRFAQIQLAETPTAKALKTFEFYHELAALSQNSVYPLMILNFRSIYLTLGTWLVQAGCGPELERRLQWLVTALAQHQIATAVQQNTENIAFSLTELLRR